jgi:hypothetical protein
MRLTKEAIEQFQTLYEKEFGEAISYEEAEVRANEIIHLYLMLAEPLPGEREEARPQDDPQKELR